MFEQLLEALLFVIAACILSFLYDSASTVRFAIITITIIIILLLFVALAMFYFTNIFCNFRR